MARTQSPCYVFSYPADGAEPTTGDTIIYDSTLKKWKTQAGVALPIAMSDVTGLVAALAGKQPVGPYLTSPIAQTDVTGLVAALASKATLPITEADVTNLVADLAATEKTANKGAVSGYAGLNVGQQLTNNLAAVAQIIGSAAGQFVRSVAGIATWVTLAATDLLTILGSLSAAQIITLLSAPNNTTTFLRGDGTFAAPTAAVTLSTQKATTTATQTTTSATYVDVSGMTLTLPNRAGGYAIVTFQCYGRVTGVNQGGVALNNNGSIVAEQEGQDPTLGSTILISAIVALNGQVVKAQFKTTGAASFNLYGSAALTNGITKIESLEIGG